MREKREKEIYSKKKDEGRDRKGKIVREKGRHNGGEIDRQTGVYIV
jgi:hypothetical protein